MLTLLGSVLGFGTSFLPSVLGFFQAKSDQKHELAMIDKQSRAAARVASFRLDETHVDAGIREVESLHEHDAAITENASTWVKNLSASVRPIITYLMFIEWAGLTVAVMMKWMTWASYNAIWDEPAQALFAAVISFWFGSRTFNRKSHS